MVSPARPELIADPNDELVRQMTAHTKSLQQVRTSPQDSSEHTTSCRNTNRTAKILHVEIVEEAIINDNVVNKKCREEEEEAHTGRESGVCIRPS